jgi:FkbM family methyltransferase
MTAGILTMAYGPARYLRMAKGLARSIRLRNPRTMMAIVTDREPASLRPWFDIVVPVNHEYGPGLAQKLHLDLYSPFDRTLYIDSDFLVFRDLGLIWNQFSDVEGFSLFGFHLAPGEAHYAIDDLPAYMAKLGIARMVMTNTGILFFDRSATARNAFEKAREISENAERLGLRRHPVGFFNDEPIFGSVVELLGLPFVQVADRLDADAATASPFTLASFGTSGMTDIDVRRGASRHVLSGAMVEPAAIHFNVDSQQSKIYDRELRRLDFGRRFGRTRAPDLVTDLLWSVRSLAPMTRRTFGRLRRAAVLADGLPHSSFIRRAGPTEPAPLVDEAARHSRPPFTFVQVGANDGLTGDPLFETVSRAEVRGLLIEPMPEMFERLTSNYASKPGLSMVQVAVGEDEGTRELYWVPSRPGDPIWVDLLGSFSRDVILSHAAEVPGIADRIQTLSVPCRTLSSLVVEHGFTRIDLLHIDAEGSDLAILRTLDFDARWAPRCILYEQKHLGPDATEAMDLLHRAGYHTLDLGMDVFAFRGLKGRLRALLHRSWERRRAHESAVDACSRSASTVRCC